MVPGYWIDHPNTRVRVRGNSTHEFRSGTGIVDKASKPLSYVIVGGYKSFCGSSGIVI